MFCSRTLEHSQIPKCIKTGHFTTLERTQIAISSENQISILGFVTQRKEEAEEFKKHGGEISKISIDVEYSFPVFQNILDMGICSQSSNSNLLGGADFDIIFCLLKSGNLVGWEYDRQITEMNLVASHNIAINYRQFIPAAIKINLQIIGVSYGISHVDIFSFNTITHSLTRIGFIETKLCNVVDFDILIMEGGLVRIVVLAIDPVDKDSVIILYEISGGIKQVGSHPIKNYEHPDYLPQTPKLTGMDAFPHAYLSKIYTPHTLNPNKIYFTTERGLLMFIFRHDSEEATKTYHIFGPGPGNRVVEDYITKNGEYWFILLENGNLLYNKEGDFDFENWHPIMNHSPQINNPKMIVIDDILFIFNQTGDSQIYSLERSEYGLRSKIINSIPGTSPILESLLLPWPSTHNEEIIGICGIPPKSNICLISKCYEICELLNIVLPPIPSKHILTTTIYIPTHLDYNNNNNPSDGLIPMEQSMDMGGWLIVLSGFGRSRGVLCEYSGDSYECKGVEMENIALNSEVDTIAIEGFGRDGRLIHISSQAITLIKLGRVEDGGITAVREGHIYISGGVVLAQIYISYNMDTVVNISLISENRRLILREVKYPDNMGEISHTSHIIDLEEDVSLLNYSPYGPLLLFTYTGSLFIFHNYTLLCKYSLSTQIFNIPHTHTPLIPHDIIASPWEKDTVIVGFRQGKIGIFRMIVKEGVPSVKGLALINMAKGPVQLIRPAGEGSSILVLGGETGDMVLTMKNNGDYKVFRVLRDDAPSMIILGGGLNEFRTENAFVSLNKDYELEIMCVIPASEDHLNKIKLKIGITEGRVHKLLSLPQNPSQIILLSNTSKGGRLNVLNINNIISECGILNEDMGEYIELNQNTANFIIPFVYDEPIPPEGIPLPSVQMLSVADLHIHSAQPFLHFITIREEELGGNKHLEHVLSVGIENPGGFGITGGVQIPNTNLLAISCGQVLYILKISQEHNMSRDSLYTAQQMLTQKMKDIIVHLSYIEEAGICITYERSGVDIHIYSPLDEDKLQFKYSTPPSAYFLGLISQSIGGNIICSIDKFGTVYGLQIPPIGVNNMDKTMLINIFTLHYGEAGLKLLPLDTKEGQNLFEKEFIYCGIAGSIYSIQKLNMNIKLSIPHITDMEESILRLQKMLMRLISIKYYGEEHCIAQYYGSQTTYGNMIFLDLFEFFVKRIPQRIKEIIISELSDSIQFQGIELQNIHQIVDLFNN